MGYVTKLLSIASAILLMVAATNYAVDPYGALDPEVDGQPQTQRLFESNVRLAKAHIVSRFRPEAVILGSSRVEVGISPSHPDWQYERVYNLGLPQASLLENVEYLEHAIAPGALKQVVVGLDFFQFNPALQPRPDFAECRLLDPGSNWARIRASLCDVPALFLSRRAFLASITQWLPHDSGVYLRDGSRSREAKETALRSAGSQHAAFLLSESEYFDDPQLLRGFLESAASFEETSGLYFEELLRLSHRNDLDLRLFLSPFHARHLELIREMGLWEEFLRWKRYLLVATHKVAEEFDAPPYPVWDFSVFSVYTTEPLPALEDRDSRMRWHWESSHYTRALGDLVLSQVLAGKTNRLGRKLAADDIDTWFHRINARGASYRQSDETGLQLMHDYLISGSQRSLPAMAVEIR